jgi:hypothetical protein
MRTIAPASRAGSRVWDCELFRFTRSPDPQLAASSHGSSDAQGIDLPPPSPYTSPGVRDRSCAGRPGPGRRGRRRNSWSTLKTRTSPPILRYWRSNTGTPLRARPLPTRLWGARRPHSFRATPLSGARRDRGRTSRGGEDSKAGHVTLKRSGGARRFASSSRRSWLRGLDLQNATRNRKPS